jgi:hypothetical protein
MTSLIVGRFAPAEAKMAASLSLTVVTSLVTSSLPIVRLKRYLLFSDSGEAQLFIAVWSLFRSVFITH